MGSLVATAKAQRRQLACLACRCAGQDRRPSPLKAG
jgi:hypothetical protein